VRSGGRGVMFKTNIQPEVKELCSREDCILICTALRSHSLDIILRLLETGFWSVVVAVVGAMVLAALVVRQLPVCPPPGSGGDLKTWRWCFGISKKIELKDEVGRLFAGVSRCVKKKTEKPLLTGLRGQETWLWRRAMMMGAVFRTRLVNVSSNHAKPQFASTLVRTRTNSTPKKSAH
jgi:hypothetical protein